MVTCPNGHANPEHQQYCGQCGAPLAVASQPPHVSWPPAVRPAPPRPSRRRRSRWLLITAVAVAVVAVVAALAVWLTNRPTDSDRWSAYPHTMGCVLADNNDPHDPSIGTVPLTDDVRVSQVTLAHPGGQQLDLSVEFAESVPPVPRTVYSSGPEQDEPGSIRYSVRLAPTHNTDEKGEVDIQSPSNGESWKAGVTTLDRPHQPTLISTQVSGKVVKFTLDLSGQNRLFGTGRFTPWVLVDVVRQGVPSGMPMLVFTNPQICQWDNPVTDQSGPSTESTTPPTIAVPQPRAAPPPGTGGWGSPSQAQTVPTPNPGVLEFQSPTGNIVCQIGPTGADCEIREHDYPVPAPPPNCAEYGDRFAMDLDGGGFIACHMGNFFGRPLPTQAYGVPVTVGPITCEINEDTGATCRASTTGHFFRVSRQSYQVG
jgi:hypothetical protein